MGSIGPSPSLEHWERAQTRQRGLLKPPGALGHLEDVACWLAACQRRDRLLDIDAAITVFAADHGVACRGVSAYPASVTAQMLSCLAAGRAAINVLAKTVNARLTIVDVGVNSAVPAPRGIENERLARGTADLSVGAAMTPELVTRALEVGRRYATRAVESGANLLIAGEIGIGNTTAAACLCARLLKRDPDSLVGFGTGISAQQHRNKLEIVRAAVRRGGDVCALGALAEYGGLEIAAMCGFYLQAAQRATPCVLDGVISTAAALCAVAIDPAVRPWLLASHLSAEPAHRAALDHLHLKPCIHADMRLGEGTGAALAIPYLRAAVALHNDMGSLAELDTLARP